jgi:chaperone modulatory protein CbpM
MKISKQEFLIRSGLGQETLVSWLEERWLIPSESSVEMSFSDIDIARAQLICDLHDVMGVNDEGVSVILHLVDQLYGMRRTLTNLQNVVQRPSD